MTLHLTEFSSTETMPFLLPYHLDFLSVTVCIMNLFSSGAECGCQCKSVVKLSPLLWTSGDVCPGFNSQDGFSHLCALLPEYS